MKTLYTTADVTRVSKALYDSLKDPQSGTYGSLSKQTRVYWEQMAIASLDMAVGMKIRKIVDDAGYKIRVSPS